MYATFFAHILRPPRLYVVDRYTHQRLLPGQIGDLQVVVNWDGLIRILVFSLIVFALVWCVMRLIAKCRRELGKQIVGRSNEIGSYRRHERIWWAEGLTNAGDKGHLCPSG